MAHAQATDGIKNAVRAGIRSIEHGIFLDDEGIELMLRNGAWLMPTLGAGRGVIAAADAGTVFPPGVLEKAGSVVEQHFGNVRRAIEAFFQQTAAVDETLGAPAASHAAEDAVTA